MYTKNINLMLWEADAQFNLEYDENNDLFTITTYEMVEDEEKSTKEKKVMKKGDCTELFLNRSEVEVFIKSLTSLLPKE